YRELRVELESLGEIFHTESDTEVMLRSYAQWGSSCVLRLNGMFAFAILHPNGEEIFLARDPIGIKPLYYAQTREGFVFASEIKGIIESGLTGHDLDFSKVPFFLENGYFPRESTPFKG